MPVDPPDIVFFDLDYTLINTDTELTWKNLLADLGIVPEEERAQQQHYIDLHGVGETPAEEYLEFLLRDFRGKTIEEMQALAVRNFTTYVQDQVYAEAIALIDSLGSRGIPAVLLSGSNRILVTPVAEAVGITDIVCTELETVDGKFTGKIVGEFCIRGGKLKQAEDYCRNFGTTLDEVEFYGDSMSDIPIFEAVGRPHVVNPSPKLSELATDKGWPILRWG